MDTATTLSDKLLSLVGNFNVPVLPNHIDPVDALALVIGGTLLVAAWIVVLKIAATNSETTSPQP